MRNTSIAIAFTSLLVVPSCYSEGRFGKFDQTNVIAFSIEGEASPSLVYSDTQKIKVTLPAGATADESLLNSLQLSSLATASAKVGDTLDLSDDYTLVVTAEDGSTVNWLVETTQQGGGTGGSPGLGGAGGGSGDCASHVLTYQVNGTFTITDTPASAGDGVFTVGPGTMSFRLIPTGEATAEVTVLSYDMPQYFEVNAPGALSINDSRASAGPNECGLAKGSLTDATVSWQTCDYGPTPPLGSTSWSASDVVGGAGCLNDYAVKGTVTCTGSFCSLSGVDFPIELDDIYPQPLNAVTFGESFGTFSMKGLGAPVSGAGRPGVELPNKEPSRTWLGLDGTLTDSYCEAIPACD